MSYDLNLSFGIINLFECTEHETSSQFSSDNVWCGLHELENVVVLCGSCSVGVLCSVTLTVASLRPERCSAGFFYLIVLSGLMEREKVAYLFFMFG